MFGCTCACRHDGHGFNHSEDATGAQRAGREGGERGGRANRADLCRPLGSFTSSRVEHHWELKTQKTHIVTGSILKKWTRLSQFGGLSRIVTET